MKIGSEGLKSLIRKNKGDLSSAIRRNLTVNLVFALYHGYLGFSGPSWWFLTLCAYYTVLSILRFSLLRVRQKSAGDLSTERFAKKFTGWLLLLLAWCLAGTVILSAVKDRGTRYHEIVMITMALFSFTKITLAILSLVKGRKDPSPVTKALVRVAFCDAAVSIASLQRSMLVSFPGMGESEIRLMNILTGSGVCLLVLLCGLSLIEGKYYLMAKSKLIEANEKIAEAVVGGYKKVESAVVDGYKKVETAVVDGYTKVEDKFVDRYLTRDGETVEEAKARLKKEGTEEK